MNTEIIIAISIVAVVLGLVLIVSFIGYKNK